MANKIGTVKTLRSTLDLLESMKVEKRQPDGDYDSVLRYIFGRPPASQPWRLENAAGVVLYDEPNLNAFTAAIEADGFVEWNGAGALNEQHFICPCPPGGPFTLTTGDPEISEVIDCIPIAEAGPIPEKINQILCALRTQECNSAAILACLKEANELADVSVAKQCLIEDGINGVCQQQLAPQGLDKTAQTLTLQGNVVANYPAGQNIDLQNANGESCGTATSTGQAVYNDQTDVTVITLEECELDEGKQPAQITQAKPVKALTAVAIKTVKAFAVKKLTAKTVKTPVVAGER